MNKMAWEYLDQLDERYKQVSDLIGPCKGDVVLELNSGNSRLPQYLTGEFTYISNDLYNPAAAYKYTDEQMIKTIDACDIFMCFGIGGYEISLHPLESATITNSIKTGIKKYQPRLIVIEAISEYKDILVTIMEACGGYEVQKIVENHFKGVTPEYCGHRYTVILRRKDEYTLDIPKI